MKDDSTHIKTSAADKVPNSADAAGRCARASVARDALLPRRGSRRALLRVVPDVGRRARTEPFALGLELNPEPQRHAIHVVVIRDDAGRIVNRPIAQLDPSQLIDIARRDLSGTQGELERVRHERARARRQCRRGRIAGERGDQIVVLCDPTERLSVMVDSIMAPVG